ncbi:PREDICTED: uncharacterized protein LOC106808913 [Priapulus caudatus]|uniref:Uncharacterized protein LOC106808913 n=1 Tax=Priapulus caudatus TaxID=37621 RepID=A0ABM1E542_PRICU|nr:PREDICTED: uncharacterized protein LOC106808913 [Priapulus caudatus]
MSHSSWLLIVLALGALPRSESHIRLIFPPARKYDFDALDNIDSEGPCGMPRGFGPKTSLVTGSSVNVVWNMAWIGPASIRPLLKYSIELLDTNDKVITELASAKYFVSADDEVPGLARVIQLPANLTGLNFVLRMSSNLPENITFWSCSDVDIIQKADVDLVGSREFCSGNGDLKNEDCLCDYLYSGERCQFEDECWKDIDCGSGRGECKDTGMIGSYPRMQCYCRWGYFGKKCSRDSSIMDLNINPDKYRIYELGRWITVFWRILARDASRNRTQDEIEVIIRSVGESYVALGWRPADMTIKCQDFPELPGGFYPGENKTSSHLDQPHPHSGMMQRPLHPMACTDMVIASAKGNLTRVFDYYSWDMATPRVDEFFGGQDDLLAAIGHERAGVTTVLFRKKLVAMEMSDHSFLNEDMHVIWARGRAFYHSLYQSDVLKYHGVGADNRGQTLINFHSSKHALNEACYDNNCQSGSTCMSRGRGHYVCLCPAGFTGVFCEDEIDPCDYSMCRNGGTCMRKDLTYDCQCEEGYIGAWCEFRTVSSNIRSVNVSWTPCSGSFQHPPGCTDECVYKAAWNYSETIEFVIQAKTYGKVWTGIGFNKHPSMLNADVIIGWVNGGVSSVTDRHLNMFYMKPDIDQEMRYYFNGVYNIHTSLIDGITTIEFSRDRKTWDEDDFWFTDDDCAYFLFPVYGGVFDVMTDYIGEHTDIPFISSEKICISKCEAKEEEVVIGKTTALPMSPVTASVTEMEAVAVPIDPLGVSGGCSDPGETTSGNATLGEVWSLNYPDRDYPNGIICHWLIKVHPDKFIKLSFIDFYTEPSHDYLELVDAKHRRFSGFNYPISIVSDGPEIELKFVTDKFLTKPGFKLLYETIDNYTKAEQTEQLSFSYVQQICYSRTFGGVHPYIAPTYTASVSDPNIGMITSPGFPFALPRDLDCRWVILASNVAITSLFGELPPSTSLQLYEGACRDWSSEDELACALVYARRGTFALTPDSTLYSLVTLRLVTEREYRGRSYANADGMTGFQLKYEIARHLLSPQAKYVVSYAPNNLTFGEWAGVAISVLLAVFLVGFSIYGLRVYKKKRRERVGAPENSLPHSAASETQLVYNAGTESLQMAAQDAAIDRPPSYCDVVMERPAQPTSTDTQDPTPHQKQKGLPTYAEAMALADSSAGKRAVPAVAATTRNGEVATGYGPAAAADAMYDEEQGAVGGADAPGGAADADPVQEKRGGCTMQVAPPEPPARTQSLEGARDSAGRETCENKVSIKIGPPSTNEPSDSPGETNATPDRRADRTGRKAGRHSPLQLLLPLPPPRSDSLAGAGATAVDSVSTTDVDGVSVTDVDGAHAERSGVTVNSRVAPRRGSDDAGQSDLLDSDTAVLV